MLVDKRCGLVPSLTRLQIRNRYRQKNSICVFRPVLGLGLGTSNYYYYIPIPWNDVRSDTYLITIYFVKGLPGSPGEKGTHGDPGLLVCKNMMICLLILLWFILAPCNIVVLYYSIYFCNISSYHDFGLLSRDQQGRWELGDQEDLLEKE